MSYSEKKCIGYPKTEITKINIERLKNQLKQFENVNELVEYTVTESFKKRQDITYSLYNLKIETEDEYVVCDDADGVLSEESEEILIVDPVLRMFLIESINEIIETCYEDDNHYYVKIMFKDGTIDINALIN
jgi:hypothetical protein